MSIEIYAKTVTMKEMVARYGCPSLGDYWRNHKDLINIRSLDIGNQDYEFLIMLHEMIEEYLCTKRGVKEQDIQAFDNEFDKKALECEPGDDPQAPYYKEHQIATIIERLVAYELGIDWEKYGTDLEKLFEETPKVSISGLKAERLF